MEGDLLHFEVDKYYMHTTGRMLHIIDEVYTTLYGITLLAEDESGKLLAVGYSSDHAVNYREIDEEEYKRNFY